MTRVPRCLVLAIVSVFVASLAIGTGDGHVRAEGSGPFVRVAQKTRAKKKARGKRLMQKDEAATDASEKPATAAAPADGLLKFSRDIAPILVSNCAGCHNAKQKRGKLDMTSFETLMTGTPKEKVIAPGKPEESHLILRLRGVETPKMPQGPNRTLSEAAIARIEQWVKAGAALDPGIDARAPMEKYAASPDDLRKAELAKLTPEQRDKQVETAGRALWKKASPKTTPEVATSAHFLLLGALPRERAQVAVKAVESQLAAVKGLVGPGAVDWGEKATLFVFNDAASFGEFVRAAEGREVEAGDVATAKFSVPHPYVAVVDPLGGREETPGSAARRPGRPRRGGSSADDDGAAGGSDRTLAGLLAEQFAVGAAAATGKPPRWLTLGLGALVASRVEGRAAYYQKLRNEARKLCDLGWSQKAQQALGDETKAGEVRAVGFAICECLSTAYRAEFPAIISGLMGGGEKLDDVLGKTMNVSREEFLQGTGQFVMDRSAR